MGDIITAIGVALATLGTVLIFYFAVPARVRRRGASYFTLEETDENDLARERRDECIGKAGLAVLLIGSSLQILALFICD